MAFLRRITPDIKKRITREQSVQVDWTKACSTDLLKTVEGHAKAVGAPKEYIFFPLLTVAASFMGVNAKVDINQEWSEPAILWTVEAGRKGEKKIAAMKRLLRAVEVGLIKFNYGI